MTWQLHAFLSALQMPQTEVHIQGLGFREAIIRCFTSGTCLAGIIPANDSIESREAPAVPVRQSCIGPVRLKTLGS